VDLPAALRSVTENHDLTREEMTDVMRQIMGGEATPAQIGGFLIGLRMKGETVEEIAAAARVMRELAAPVHVRGSHVVDIVGTGGDASHTFMAAPPLTEAAPRHQKIAWAGQSGYPWVKYCCTCSYFIRLKASTAYSQKDCPNQACTDCHSEGPFCCTRTKELRRAREIPHPVTHVAAVDVTPSTSPDSPDSPPQQPAIDTDDEAVRADLLSNHAEAL